MNYNSRKIVFNIYQYLTLLYNITDTRGSNMKILILGNSGSGKSTFTQNLAKKMNIPFLHLDTIIYQHNWQKPEFEHAQKVVLDFIKQDNWIIDGNFLNQIQQRFDACNRIYFLDFNRFICFFSILKRYFKYKGKKRSSRSPFCDEKLSRDYLKWVFFDFYKTSRKKIYHYLKNHPEKEIIIFKNRHQLKKYLKEEF